MDSFITSDVNYGDIKTHKVKRSIILHITFNIHAYLIIILQSKHRSIIFSKIKYIFVYYLKLSNCKVSQINLIHSALSSLIVASHLSLPLFSDLCEVNDYSLPTPVTGRIQLANLRIWASSFSSSNMLENNPVAMQLPSRAIMFRKYGTTAGGLYPMQPIWPQDAQDRMPATGTSRRSRSIRVQCHTAYCSV